jgi:Domain of unknown function (DUF4292)
LWKSLIILILILNLGCKSSQNLYQNSSGLSEEYSKNLINTIRENNISVSNFFIEKADFLLNRNNNTIRFLFYVKFKKPDKYIISIRSIGGIEAARIYLSKDTILINDRMRKKLLYGKPENIRNIYQEPYFNINMAFGDLFLGEDSIRTETERINKNLIIKGKSKGKSWLSVINPGINKVLSLEFLNEINKKTALINYSKY